MKNLQKKIKTYVIIVSSYFPKTHSKAETPTGFIENIGNNKLHTLRAGYHNWKKKFEYYLSTPEKEKYLNLTLKKVMTNNPGAMREQTFKLLEQQLGNPND